MESSNHLRALAHPVRLRILSLLTGADLTAAEVARELGITHANASYHLRFLLDAGEIVVERRGDDPGRAGQALPPPVAGRGPPDRARRPRTPGRAGARRPRRPPRSCSAGARDPPPRASRAWSPMPSCGSTPETWERARALLEEASALAARRRPPAAHRGHRAGEPLAVRVRHGRPREPAATSLGPLRHPAFAWYLASRTVNLPGPDRRVGGDGLRGARPRGLGDRPWARCSPPAPCRWCCCCSSAG